MPSTDLYEAVRYPGHAYPDSHPDRLAVMAILHGLSPAPVERCRVLEVGCSEGSNLIPMASAIPLGQFVGFDLSEAPVARAKARAAALGLTNAYFFQADLMTIGEELGEFDFIIAHGVYAWVPPAVQDGLLRLCRNHLAPQGIAYINYNCLPGAHIRHWMRDLALLAPGGNNAEARIAATLDLIQVIGDSRPADDPYRKVLELQARLWKKRNPNGLFHDELSEAFEPVSFSTFVRHASAHDLKFVSDSSFPLPTDPVFKPETANFAKAFAGGDRIATEEVLDAVRMRMYRETLLCRAENLVLESPNLEALQKLSFTSQTTASLGKTAGAKVFALPSGLSMESQHRDTIALMEFLIAAYPESVPVTHLQTFLSASGVALDGTFYTQVFRLVVAKMIDVHAWQAPVSRHVGELPKSNAACREEFRTTGTTTSLRYGSVTFYDPLLQHCFLLADGTRDRTALVKALSEASPEIPETAIAANIERALETLNRAAVLQTS